MAYTKRPAIIKVERSTGSGTPDWTGGDGWQEIPGITGTVNLPSATPKTVDITTMNDLLVSGFFTQKGAGISDVKDLSLNVLFDGDDVVHSAMLDDEAALTVRDYRFTINGQTRKYGARGQIAIDAQGQIGDYVRATVSLVVNLINLNV